MSEFGYTNSDADYAKVVAWRDAAVADGWTLNAVYKKEPETSYGHLSKDGFTVHACCRVTEEMKKRFAHYSSKWKYEAQINVWGPDGLAVRAPENYNWAELVAATRKCHHCGKTDVDTVRYSFAGRCCHDCLPAMKAQHEQPGWCD